MKVIINNDDFGLSHGFNLAIEDCFKNGITTSTSIRTNGVAYKQAVSSIKSKLNKIGLGVHLNLSDGKTSISKLADKKGNYKRQFFNYLIELIFPNPSLLQAIESDLRHQLEKAIKKDRLKIDHLDSHEHVHMIPPIFRIVCKLAQEFSIPYVRIANENWYTTRSLKQYLTPFINTNIIKFIILKIFSQTNIKTLKQYDLHTSDRFYGIIYSGHMNTMAIIEALRDAMKHHLSVIEILAHPALITPLDTIYTSDFIRWYSHQKERVIENLTLKDTALRKFIINNKISL